MATRKTTKTSAAKVAKPQTKSKTVAVKKVATKSTVTPSLDTQRADSPKSTVRRFPLRLKKIYIVLAVIAIVLIGLAVYYRSLFVVATVNGQPISRLAYITETEAVYIPDAQVTAGKQALNQLVTKALLYQEANRRHLTVSDKEINDEVAATRKNLEKSGQKLETALSQQGDTLQAYKDRVKIQKLIQKIIGTITVTDKEVADYIEKNKDSIPEGTNPDEVKTQVTDTIKNQKYNEKLQALIQGLQQKAKVNYLITQ